MTPTDQILIVEDSELKYLEIDAVVADVLGSAYARRRAPTLTNAEQLVEVEKWSGIILDISMDIAASSAGPGRGGHATLGGLSLARKMHLLGCEAPTIIVTAFDSFPSSMTGKGNYEALGLEEVERRAGHVLGTYLLGCVRYGDFNWEIKFRNHLERILLR